MRKLFGTTARWAGRLAGLGVAATTLAACSMGGFLGGGGNSAQQYANTSATPTEIAQAANSLPAIATTCPPIKVKMGGEAMFNYKGGRTGDANALHYQAVIDKATRNCVVSKGLITVQMGVSGRVLLGPSGNETSVTLPVRFAVERDGAPLFTEKYNIAVALPPPVQQTEFTKVVENVAVPYVGGDDIVIWVGFDAR